MNVLAMRPPDLDQRNFWLSGHFLCRGFRFGRRRFWVLGRWRFGGLGFHRCHGGFRNGLAGYSNLDNGLGRHLGG